MADLCKHCGKPESEHHAFEKTGRRWRWPAECVCDRKGYFAQPLPVCDEYKPYGETGTCARCEHDRACHAPKD